MQIIRDPAEMTAWSGSRHSEGKRIGFVPTMGFFHEGHLSLMRRASSHCEHVVVSLFVNPTQFGPNEDLDAYPRDFERDRKLAEDTGATVLFVPDAEVMYPPGCRTTIRIQDLTEYLCGASRPGHFAGVATVVAKLFNIVQPEVAVFGQKDYQQLAVIRRMSRDLNMGVEIIGHPIVREPDGLAMSSRNAYLLESQRDAALSLSQAIILVRKLAAAGERDVEQLVTAATQCILSHKENTIDYISFVDQEIQPVSTVDRTTVMALAVKIGDRVRLIDNGLVLADDFETENR